jgi:hypothetical protein
MGGEMKWKYLTSSTQHYYQHQLNSGVQLEISNDGVYWVDKSGNTFHSSHYYRIKQETSMTKLNMISFGNLDPVKQGEILVAHRNNRLMMWSDGQQQWTLVCSNCVYDSIVYCIKAAPRVCYVGFDKDNRPVSTTGYKVLGSVLMREVTEDSDDL